MTDLDPEALVGDTCERLRHHALAYEASKQASAALMECSNQLVMAAQHSAELPARSLAEVIDYLSEGLRAKLFERARQLGWQVATYMIAPEAQQSGVEPVVFITGNSFMPPMRAYGPSDVVWRLDANDDGDLFAAYHEAIESRLDELRVYMACPEYDNALYVVDEARFEHVESNESEDSLSAEWKAIEP